MTRINSNVSSLIAQNTLARSNNQLQESLTRLSTGLRINTGKDDPAGLIASEALRADITSVNKAITNSQRANQLIATADSALGQVAGLLNDIRGLVVEAANSGVLSDEQIAANQLQIDSSLEAIDRIAQVTTFQSKKLLDGSLDFNTAYTAGGATVRNLAVTQANLGTAGQVTVNVDITTAATQAQITNDSFVSSAGVAASGGTLTFTDTTITTPGNEAAGTITFTDITTPATQAAGTFSLAATVADIDISAVAGETSDGLAGNTTQINITSGATTGATYNAGTDTIDLVLAAGATVDDAIGVIDGLDEFTAALGSTGTGTDVIAAGDIGGGPASANLTGGADAVTGNDVITIEAANSGLAYNGTLTFTSSSGQAAGTVGVNVTSGNITVTVNDNDNWTTTNLAAAIDTALGANYNATVTTSAGDGAVDTALDTPTTANLTGGTDDVTATANDVITIAATGAGTAFNGTITFQTNGTQTAGTVGATVASNGNITITARNTDTWNLSTLATAIGTALGTDYSVALGTNAADGSYDASTDSNPTTTALSGGTNDVYAALAADLVVKISGSKGAEVFNFASGSSITQVVSAINLLKDSTGVEATNNAGTLELDSTDYGSNAFVDAEVISEGTGGLFEANLSSIRDSGTDIVATVNGVQANGKGNSLSVSTASLALSLTVDDGSTTDVSFNITGGGALFQIGPDVVTNQQARIGISSVNTGKLGGVSGRLYELRSGGSKALDTDAAGAASVVDEVLTSVTSLRGRLGAFQRTTLETNIQGLNDTLTNLTDAQSSIRDADFAAESARLTRAQILVQSGTAVLQIANSSPQNVLSLLRG